MPMQGTVVKVLVKPGDVVEAGQAVCVLEAMKMENNIVSQFAGQVTEVRVEAGDPVGTGDVIVVLGDERGLRKAGANRRGARSQWAPAGLGWRSGPEPGVEPGKSSPGIEPGLSCYSSSLRQLATSVPSRGRCRAPSKSG